jgi:hypothetical protein
VLLFLETGSGRMESPYLSEYWVVKWWQDGVKMSGPLPHVLLASQK